MERLTFEGNFCELARCKGVKCQYDTDCSQKQVWERLKAYEDTGLTPERCAEFARADAEGRYIVMRDAEQEGVARLRELAVADKDGRCVVLPCKVGDTVYRLQYIEQTPRRITVGVVPIKFALIWLEELGKTVFLTREEAEKALAEMEGKKDGTA
jgi:hypothetical protein|nr:MAG TPA: hypothetical protein [Caudoviricetes sp.]